MKAPLKDRRQKVRRVTDLMNTHQIESLLEASKLMNATLDLDQLLRLIMTLATQNLNAERSTLYLVDHENEEIWSKILLGEEMLHIRLPIGQGIAGHVARSGEVVNIENAYEDPRFYKGVDGVTGSRNHRGSSADQPE